MTLRTAPQRQDSLASQMATVKRMAIAAGCYDANDWLTRHFPWMASEMSPKTQENKPSTPGEAT